MLIMMNKSNILILFDDTFEVANDLPWYKYYCKQILLAEYTDHSAP